MSNLTNKELMEELAMLEVNDTSDGSYPPALIHQDTVTYSDEIAFVEAVSLYLDTAENCKAISFIKTLVSEYDIDFSIDNYEPDENDELISDFIVEFEDFFETTGDWEDSEDEEDCVEEEDEDDLEDYEEELLMLEARLIEDRDSLGELEIKRENLKQTKNLTPGELLTLGII